MRATRCAMPPEWSFHGHRLSRCQNDGWCAGGCFVGVTVLRSFWYYYYEEPRRIDKRLAFRVGQLCQGHGCWEASVWRFQRLEIQSVLETWTRAVKQSIMILPTAGAYKKAYPGTRVPSQPIRPNLQTHNSRCQTS
eukprot:586560-Rhodomonas_salina.2